jgi:hypothetical protein
MGFQLSEKKILLVSSLNQISPANYLIDAFEEMSIDILAVSDVRGSRADVVSKGAFDVSRFLAKFNYTPDLLLFVEGGEMGVFPVNYEDLDFPSIWWGIDTHNDYRKHLRISRLFDHSFIAQKSFVTNLQVDGIASVSWLPLAYPKKEKQVAQRDIDISYVGSTDWSKYPERGLILNTISDSFSNTFVDQASPERMFEIYEKSKLVFNYSPKNDLNMRFFEAIGSGAVLITNHISNNGVEDLFQKNIDFLEYSSPEELVSTLAQVLNDKQRLDFIASNGVNKILNNHTYHQRAIEILHQTRLVQRKNGDVSFDTSAALLSMGIISGAIWYFFLSLKNEALGKRSRLILVVVTPVFILLASVVRVIEGSLNSLRRRRW